MADPTEALPVRRPARRLRDLDTGQWLLIGETLATLAAASLAIAVLPFRQVVRLASHRRTRAAPARRRLGQTDDLCWAVEAIARRVPWRTVCFQKGLALHLMLRRRAIPSSLHYGIGKDQHGALAAHVWISIDDRIVQGGDVVDRFHCVARYPADT